MARQIANGLTALAVVIAALMPMTKSVEATDIVADEIVDLNSGGVYSENSDYVFYAAWGGSNLGMALHYVGPGDEYGVWSSFVDGLYGGFGFHQNHWASVDIDGYGIMQGDGNFVLYDSQDSPGWSTSTYGNSGSRMSVQNDGNLVIYNPFDTVRWAIF